MRIYVRQEPLKRPVALDIGPYLSVGELRAHVGAEALYLATRGAGAVHSQDPDGCGTYDDCYADGARLPPCVATVQLVGASVEPLDDASIVMEIVPPHGTLTVGARPLPSTRSTSRVLPTSETFRTAPDSAHGGHWHLTKNPTPLLTSAPLPATARGPGGAGKTQSTIGGTGLTSTGCTGLETTLETALGADVPGSSATVNMFPVNDPDPDASHISGSCASLPIGGLLEEEPLLAPPSIGGNPAPSPPGGQPQRLHGQHGERLLGEDWEDLSVVEEIDDQTISERGAWSLASEIVHNALVDEERIDSLEGVFTSLSDEQHAINGMLPGSAAPQASGGKLPAGPKRQSYSEELQSTMQTGAEQGQPESLIFAWGDNSSGQCLVGDSRRTVETPENVPLRCLCTSLCCGSECSILVTKRGTDRKSVV